MRHVLTLVSITLAIALQSEADVIGFWNFDETSGTTASDSSGSGNNGTLTGGATFDPGAGPDGGGAVSLNNQASNNQYVTMGNVYAFSGNQSFTLEAWINTGDTASAAIVGRHFSDYQDGYFLGLNAFDPFCPSPPPGAAGALSGNGGGGCGGVTIVGPTSDDTLNNDLTDSAWQEVVAVFDGSDSTMSLYIDGQFDNSASYDPIDSCPTVDL